MAKQKKEEKPRFLILSAAATALNVDVGNLSRAGNGKVKGSKVEVSELDVYVKSPEGLFFPVVGKKIKVVDMSQFKIDDNDDSQKE